MAFFSWSRTANSNASADATINWAEGQPPSSVNDSARAMMARTAEYRDDIAGITATTGTSTAYAFTSFQVFTSLANMNNSKIVFVPHATNTGACTLNVDGLGAWALRSASGADIPSGTLLASTPYAATFYSGSNQWILHGFYGNPYNIPIGGGMTFFGSTAPNSSFVFPTGQAISRSTYSTLFGIVSTVFGVGDGSTTFNLPDLRGRVPLIADDMGGSAAGRSTGFSLGITGGAQSHSITTAEMPAHTHVNTLTDPGHLHTYTRADSNGAGYTNVATSFTGTVSSSQNTGTATTGITINNASQGSGSAMSLIQPSLGVFFIMRVI
jgi:microcystin-dependent protein